MKKLNTDALEKMAKEKNIDKDKIENIANSYKGKSENELMDELVKIGQNLKGREEVVSKFKAFLDDDQRKKLDVIMNKISEAEVQNKIDNKKSKQKKSSHKPSKDTNQQDKATKKSSHGKNNNYSPEAHQDSPHSSKKVKKVVKKVKRGSDK
ncbi:hypothetical protein [Romboutsia lituseburensis]|uniref:hypothetical protein n=1 Tax=Romboutsia lituseburensis TaxID=1537 RepID=UPI00215A5C85|nr:hypothetical protein [Romboutsia lituseburensis]MCR8746469.1 hypothetical protein [Romboutsia lituseburensis]